MIFGCTITLKFTVPFKYDAQIWSPVPYVLKALYRGSDKSLQQHIIINITNTITVCCSKYDVIVSNFSHISNSDQQWCRTSTNKQFTHTHTHTYRGTQLGEERSISQVAKRFMGTGMELEPEPHSTVPDAEATAAPPAAAAAAVGAAPPPPLDGFRKAARSPPLSSAAAIITSAAPLAHPLLWPRIE